MQIIFPTYMRGQMHIPHIHAISRFSKINIALWFCICYIIENANQFSKSQNHSKGGLNAHELEELSGKLEIHLQGQN